MTAYNFSYSVGLDFVPMVDTRDLVVAAIEMNGCAVGLIKLESWNRGDDDTEVEYKVSFALGNERETFLNPVFVMVTEDCAVDWLDEYLRPIFEEISYLMDDKMNDYFFDLEWEAEAVLNTHRP